MADLEEKHDELFALLDQRDKYVSEKNYEILTLLAPTVFTAVSEMFELPPSNIQLATTGMSDDVLVIDLVVHYTYSEHMSYWLSVIDKSGTSTTAERSRTLRMGIPIALVFASVDEIKHFLSDARNKPPVPTEGPAVTHDEYDFDPTQLTKDQIERMVLFMLTAPGEKQ